MFIRTLVINRIAICEGAWEKGHIVQNYIFEKFMIKLCILIKMTNYMTCNGINYCDNKFLVHCLNWPITSEQLLS